MDDQELEMLLDELESDRVERKESISDRSDLRKTICAFANDLPGHGKPGVLFIGTRDDGSFTGNAVTDDHLTKLASYARDGSILPFPVLTVQKHRLKGHDVIVVEVDPALDPPVTCEQQIFVRVGPTTRRATRSEEIRLIEKRRFRDQPFDLRPVPLATRDDLDVEFFKRAYLPSALTREILEANHRPVEHQLSALRFTTPEPEGLPTVVGILTLGKDPRYFLPGAYVQFLRIDGFKLTDPIKRELAIDGPLPELLRLLDETLRTNIAVAVDFASGELETRRPDYPIEALRQLARNAVLHRTYEGTNAPVRLYWYSDRIEILSPGGPYGQVNVSNFGQPGIADYRNPHVAEVMKTLGYVQQFGVGISLAREELERNGNPPLELRPEPEHVMVIVRAAR